MKKLINFLLCEFKGHTYVRTGKCPFTGSTYQSCTRCGDTMPIIGEENAN
jgi:hypothetical protein